MNRIETEYNVKTNHQKDSLTWRKTLIIILLVVEFLVVLAYIDFGTSKKDYENAIHRRKFYSFVVRFSRLKKVFDREEKNRMDYWFQRPSRELVTDRQPAGDYVHYTNDKRLCGRSTSKLLILVNSKYHQIKERSIIRDTWGKMELIKSKVGKWRRQLSWRYVFVIANYPGRFEHANLLNDEIKNKSDVLQVDLLEHRFFETLKIYSALTWAMNSCRFEYLLFIEITNFMNTNKIYSFFHDTLQPFPREFYGGKVETKSVNVPRKENKNPSGIQLRHVTSSAIILSRSAVFRAVPLLHKQKDYSYKNPQQLIGNVMSELGIVATHIDNMLADSYCKLKMNYLLQNERKFTCFYELYEESKKS